MSEEYEVIFSVKLPFECVEKVYIQLQQNSSTESIGDAMERHYHDLVDHQYKVVQHLNGKVNPEYNYAPSDYVTVSKDTMRLQRERTLEGVWYTMERVEDEPVGNG